jgi:signal transduction histidine kinase
VRRRRPAPLDVALAVACCALVLLTVPADQAPLAFALAVGLPVAFWRVAPLAALVAVIAGSGVCTLLFGDPDSAASLPPVLLTAYAAGAHPSGRRSWAAAMVGVLFAIGVAVTPDAGLPDFFFVLGIFALPWVGGRLSRGHARRAERLRSLAAALEAERHEHERLVLAAERARIAAELNDAVAHAVGAMTMQANAAAASGSPDARRAALREIQSTGRDALLDLRRMLGLLRGAAS